MAACFSVSVKFVYIVAISHLHRIEFSCKTKFIQSKEQCMKRAVAKNIDEYIAGFPGDTQKKLNQLRSTIRKTAPGVEEKISYAIPCFTLNGNYLIYFAGFTK